MSPAAAFAIEWAAAGAISWWLIVKKHDFRSRDSWREISAPMWVFLFCGLGLFAMAGPLGFFIVGFSNAMESVRK